MMYGLPTDYSVLPRLLTGILAEIEVLTTRVARLESRQPEAESTGPGGMRRDELSALRQQLKEIELQIRRLNERSF
jgi:hypothetical protein